MGDKTRGMYEKFRVERTDGSSAPGGKHQRCRYFVLDVTHDPHAVPALLAYAESCRSEYPLLAIDVRTLAITDGVRQPLPPPPGEEPSYKCAKCGCDRTEAEGGKIFTVCDECWKTDPSNAEPTAKCANCGTLYTPKWIGTTCSVCDGTIQVGEPPAPEPDALAELERWCRETYNVFDGSNPRWLSAVMVHAEGATAKLHTAKSLIVHGSGSTASEAILAALGKAAQR